MRKVLVCDDEKDILEVISLVLSSDFDVQTQSNTDNILEEVRSFKPDIILMDVWIPNIGGTEAMGMIKKEKDLNHIPVILFSANNDLSSIAKESNADGFIKKPFKMHELKKYIHGFFNDGPIIAS